MGRFFTYMFRKKKKKKEWGQCPRCSCLLVVDKTNSSASSCGGENIHKSEKYMKKISLMRINVEDSSVNSNMSVTRLKSSLSDAESFVQECGCHRRARDRSEESLFGFMSLPLEILYRIALLVPQDTSLLALKCTCHLFNKMLADGRFWSRRCFNMHAEVHWPIVNKVLESSSSLTAVNFSGCQGVTDHLLTALVTLHPEVRCVDLSGCMLLTDFGLAQLQAGAKALREVSVAQCCLITCGGLISLLRSHGKTLRWLDISECRGMAYDPYRVSRMAEYCRYLKHLSMRWTSQSVGLNPVLDTDLLKFAKQCHGIHSLDVSCCRISDSGLEAIAHNCAGLRCLRLSHSYIKDSALRTISRHLPGLLVLDISECTYITNRGVSHLGSRLHQLRKLNLSHCFNVTDVGVSHLLSHVSRLSDLRLRGCFRVTDGAFLEPDSLCTNLAFVDLSATLVSDRGLSRLRSSGGATSVIQVVTQDCPLVSSARTRDEVLDRSRWPPSLIESPRQWMLSSTNDLEITGQLASQLDLRG